MKNRTSLMKWASHRDHHPASAGTCYTMAPDSLAEGADALGLCESWRAWEAGTSSEFLNWLLFTPYANSSATRTTVLENWICFENDQSELDERARAILEDRLKLFQKNPAMRIVIGGFTGQPSTVAQAMRIGLRRVLSIRSFLLAHGIDPGRIGIAVRGSYWSVAEASSGDGATESDGLECRLQVTDPHWTLAQN